MIPYSKIRSWHLLIIMTLLINSCYVMPIRGEANFTRITVGDVVNDGGASYSSSWADYDNDGFLDLYVGNAASPAGEINFLYHNEGDGSFTRVTGEIIISDISTTFGHAWGDYDNDGDLDFYANKSYDQKNSFYINNGDGSFTQASAAFTGDYGYSANVGWIDYDSDGDLDLYLTNEHFSPPFSQENYLFRNDDLIFTKITDEPFSTDIANSHGIAWGDYDNDGDMDLFVANAFGSSGAQFNYLYINDGDGTFTKETTGPVVTDLSISTGTSCGDYDNDGDLDLYVANTYGNSSNFLYNNNGDGTFTKVTTGDIVTDADWTWCSSWADYDNDGDLDLFLTTTVWDDSHPSKNYLYENNGDGSFTRITTGDLVNETGWSWSAAWGDYDRDGDLDIFIAKAYNNGENNALFRNDGNSNNWINIRCIGTVSNVSAIGTRIKIKATIDGDQVWQLREIAPTGYTTQHSLNAHFGLGDATLIDSIKIRWPSGLTQVLEDVEVNQFLSITEEPLCGDANRDLMVNVSDAVYIINYVFVGGPAPDPYEAGNVNCDETVNVSDAVYIINYVFVGGSAPCECE